MADYLLQEAGGLPDHIALEDGSVLLLETGDSFLLETSSVGVHGKFTLEDGSGFIILETGTVVTPPPSGGFAINVRRPMKLLFVDDDDELVALTLAVRAVKRRRLK